MSSILTPAERYARDPVCIEALLQPGCGSVWQLDAGRLEGTHTSRMLGQLHIVRARFSLAVRVDIDRAVGPLVVLPGERGPELRIGGMEIPRTAAALCHAGSGSGGRTQFELVIPGGVTASFVELGSDAIRKAPLFGDANDEGQPEVLILPRLAGQLREIVQALFASGAESSRVPKRSKSAESRLLDLLARHGEHAQTPSVAASSEATRAISLIETLVTNYLATHESPSVLEMCRVTGFSRRALTYAFQKRYGVPPKRFFRNLALNEVRQALLHSRGETLVSEIAPFYGFWHMGQFAADYRNLFEELPSETLVRARWHGRRRGFRSGHRSAE